MNGKRKQQSKVKESDVTHVRNGSRDLYYVYSKLRLLQFTSRTCDSRSERLSRASFKNNLLYAMGGRVHQKPI